VEMAGVQLFLDRMLFLGVSGRGLRSRVFALPVAGAARFDMKHEGCAYFGRAATAGEAAGPHGEADVADQSREGGLPHRKVYGRRHFM
jgi:hypothetical protein